MFPVVVTPLLSQPPLPVSTAFINNAGDAAIGRLSVSTVSPSVAVSEVNNNSRGGTQQTRVVFPQELSFATATPSAAVNTAPPALSAPLTSGPSSAFLAQILGQSSTAEGAALSSFFSTASSVGSGIIDSQILQQYAQVRYLPSNAALPPPPAPTDRLPAALLARGESAAPRGTGLPAPALSSGLPAPSATAEGTNATAVANTAQASAQISAQVSAPRAQLALNFSVPVDTGRPLEARTTSTAERRTAGSSTSTAERTVSTSLIRQRGADAYAATIDRNAFQLVDAPISQISAVV